MGEHNYTAKSTFLGGGIISKLPLLFLLTLFMAVPAFATHSSTVDLQPEWSPAGENVNYTVTFSNIVGSPDAIGEVRIYNNNDYTDFVCDPKTGWILSYPAGPSGGICGYYAFPQATNKILAGNSTDFTFSATTPETGCDLVWQFETRDITFPSTGSINYLNDTTSIDDLKPEITKTLGDPKYSDSSHTWITQNTPITINATDKGQACGVSGLKYCEYKYTVNGDLVSDWNRLEPTDLPFTFNYPEDSEHVLNVRCFDNAGNEATHTQTEFVETQSPVTTKTLGDPKFVDGLVEWITTSTPITLTAVDPAPHPSGVKQTWYLNTLAESDDACNHPKDPEYCRPAEIPEGDPAQAGWTLYNDHSFTKDEESCHVLTYYSIDNLGQVEEPKVNCFFVDDTPPVLTKEVGTPKIPLVVDEFQTIGGGTAEWTDLENYFGDYSAKLYVLDGTTDIAAIEYNVDIPLNEITALSFWQKIQNTYGVNVILGVDADGDGSYESLDKPWQFSHAASDLGDDSFVEMDGLANSSGIWEDVNALAISQWWTPDNAGTGFCAEFGWNYLSAIQSSAKCRIQPTDRVKVIRLLIGGSSSWTNKIAYVDDITLNGVIKVEPKNWWVRDHVTPITLTCTDQQPHPVDHTTIMWTISLDGAEPEKFSEEAGEVTFNFNEDSVHVLDAWCQDALDQESAHDIETFKVDSVPPVITKTMIGSFLGNCPPSNPDQNCFVADNGTSGVTVSVRDPDPTGFGCNVGNSTCTAEVWWQTSGGNCEEAQGNYVGGWCLLDSYEFGEADQNIFFRKDSTHKLKINCEDNLGNSVNDEELFLVDSTPPSTLKTYGTPFYTNGDANWISTDTNITLTATDAKSGVKDINYRVSLENDSVCQSREACNRYEGTLPDWNNYSHPFNISQQSCHVIEYFSVDNLGNTETVKRQCVFVDNTAPDVNKTIGNPKVVKSENCDSNELVDSPVSFAPDFNVGAEVHTITFPEGGGTGVGVAFDGEFLYYSYISSKNLYKIRPDGTGHAVITTSGVTQTGLGALSYDATRGKIWAGTYGCDGSGGPVYLIDPATGVATYMFSVPSTYITYCLDDGIAYDATDDSIWYSDDVSPTMVHMDTNGDFIGTVNVCAIDSRLCTNSGIAIGGDNFYLGTNGSEVTLRVHRDTLTLLDEFVNTGFRIEDMECDPVTYGPTEVMWIRDAYAGQARAYAIEPATCGLGGQEPGPVCENEETYITNETPITFTCEDKLPHPVDHVSLKYRYRFSDDCKTLNDANWTEWFDPVGLDLNKTIYFEEDSCHELEYYCEDALGNKTETFSEIDIVDTKAPVISKEILGPKTGDCPPQEEGDICIIDGVTEIQVNAVDQQPHPVDSVICDWDYEVIGGIKSGTGQQGVEPPFKINFPEESQHLLTIVCKDALGNASRDVETFYVDKTPPVISKEYAGQLVTSTGGLEQLGNGIADWVQSEKYSGAYSAKLVIPDNASGTDFAGVDSFFDVFVELDDVTSISYYKKVTQYDNGWNPIVLLGIDADGDGVFEAQPLEWEQSLSAGSVNPALLGDDSFIQCEATSGLSGTDGSFVKVDAFTSFKCYTPTLAGDNYDWSSYEPLSYFQSHNVGRVQSSDKIAMVKVNLGGNPSTQDNEIAYVDSVELNGKVIIDEPIHWINSLTQINISAVDPLPHPSGLDSLEYRISLMESDRPCENTVACQQAEGNGNWQSVDGSATIREQSCHLIEIKATDNVGKTSEHKQCVFVDNTAPTPLKTVGKPSSQWDGLDSIFYPEETAHCWDGTPNSIDCWKVTLLTPITLSCTDPNPHPVGQETVCYKVELDGDDATQSYCDGELNQNGYCCTQKAPVEFYFKEETEHNLDFYCTDALGNGGFEGVHDDEKFKVEGTAFTIELNKKWNLISVPFVLKDSTPEAVFEDVAENVQSVWAFDAFTNEWYVYNPANPDASNLDEILPGWGYWLAAYNPDTLVLGGSLFSPMVTPPSRNLKTGWNLIGYYGTDGEESYIGPEDFGPKQARCALFSLGESYLDKGWTSLFTYWELDNPDQWKMYDYYDEIGPGAGYWVSASEDSIYEYSTTCGGLIV